MPPARRLLVSPRRSVALLTAVALAAVALLAVSSIVLASNAVTKVADKQVHSTAAVSSVVIGQQLAKLVGLVHSYATRPSLAAAMVAKARGRSTVAFNLAELARAVPGISASFVTNLGGTSLNTYPPEPSVYGTNFASRDWFTGLVASGRPYVSNAIVTKESSHTLAITVTDYIRGRNGRRVGVLGVNFSLRAIASFAASVGRVQGIALTVTDRAGTSLTAGGRHGLVSVAGDPRVTAALAGRTGLLDYAPISAHGHRGAEQLSAYAPVPGSGWTVIAAVRRSSVLAGVIRLREAVLGIAALLVVILLATIRVVSHSDRRRRASELQLQSRDRELARVLDSTHEAFLATDADGAITAWNAQAEALFGWPAAGVLGLGLSDTVIPVAHRHEHAELIAGYRAGLGASGFDKRVELIGLHRDGHEMALEMSSWAKENGIGFNVFVHDITERVAAQTDLKHSRDEAMQASRLKSEFLANMSHEIRTPMNGVIGMSSLLLNTDLDDTQRDFAETASASAEALLTVIDDILDFSKIEAGKLNVESVPFDLREVVEASALLLAARAQQQGLELTCRVDPAIPPSLSGDPGRLRQVLLNLVGNAVKFTSAGEVNVDATFDRGDGGDLAVIELSVRDSGIGMAASTLDHLFDAFTQADSSTSRRYGGTGLGLAISRQLVELMGGTLTARSEVGSGSTFTVRIPFALGVSSRRLDVADLAGVRILIVDDNRTNQRVLAEMVSSWGCTSVVADGATEAISLLRQGLREGRSFDVVVLDLNMPAIDGYGLAGMVGADPSLTATPMVMLTSSAQRGEAERTQRAGIVAYLTKPVRSSRLRGALNLALAQGAPGTATSLEPAATSGEAQLEHAGARQRDAARSPLATATRSVLVVEDHAVNQLVLTSMLASLGFRADVAANGADALEAIRNNDYAAVLMDCQMPVMDGYDATAKLREEERPDTHTLVIAVTANAMPTERERCLAAGMDDYLVKPLTVESLAAVLAHWVPAAPEPPALGSPVHHPDRNETGRDRVHANHAAALEDVAAAESPALDAQIVERLERLGRDAGEDLMGELRTEFLADVDARVVTMRAAFALDDVETIVLCAHTMVGASANVGATALAGLWAGLEADGAAGSLADGPTRLDALEVELGRVRLALNAKTATR
jgi:PAS domain S-box-containing protein